MAGDWLKVEVSTPDKAEVFAIGEQLGIDADAVTGKLIRVWGWFDQHTEKGNDASVTTSLIDRIAGQVGFAQAMVKVGWMKQGQRGLELPNFDRHNGKTAKSRALTAKRVAAHKQRSDNGPLTRAPLPREEKRREEETQPSLALPAAKPNGNGKHRELRKAATAVPVEFVITEPMWSWAQGQGVQHERIEKETEKFLDHHRAKGSTFKDWDAAWRTWMRKSVEFSAARH